MCLQLSADQSFSAIQKQLKDLDSSVLLFLRNLQQISFHSRTDGYRKVVTCQNRGQPLTTITQTESLHKGAASISKAVEYIIVSHLPDPSEPELVLAFPCSIDGRPKPQKVYSFLPLRGYGFQVRVVQCNLITSLMSALVHHSNEFRSHIQPRGGR